MTTTAVGAPEFDSAGYLIQPCRLSNARVRSHAERTLFTAVGLEELGLQDADWAAEALLGDVRLWGIVPGPLNTRAWQHLRSGDVVLFCGDRAVHHVARVLYVFPQAFPDLARRLWGEDHAGRTWELMYAVSPPTAVDWPYARLREGLGYAERWNPQRVQYVPRVSVPRLRWITDSAEVTAGTTAGEVSLRVVPPPVPDSTPRPRGPRSGLVVPPGVLADGDVRRRQVGLAGERWVVEFERRRLREAGRADLASGVVHVSVEEGDGLGYDVRSFEEDGSPRLIEVKTTTGGRSTPFDFSARELEVSHEDADDYWLYRVFGFHGTPSMWMRAGPLDAEWRTRPITYRAYPGQAGPAQT